MMLGAAILCFLLMLVFLADILGGAVFHGETGARTYRCEACDLRYPKRDMIDPQLRVCPAGHVVRAERRRATAGVIGVFVCLGFLAMSLVFIVAGITR